MNLISKPFALSATALALALAVTGCSSTQANSNTEHHHHLLKQDKAEQPAMPHDGQQPPMPPQGEHGNAPHDQNHAPKHGGMQELNLTADQKAKLNALHKQSEDRMRQQHAQLKAIDDKIQQQKQAKADNATLLNLYKQRQGLHEQMMSQHKQDEAQFLNILTAEQQLKFYEAQDKHHGEPPHADEKRPPMPPKADTQNTQK